MLDWTDTHCRNFHRLLAPSARLYSEMVHANAVIHGPRAQLLALDPAEHPVALQLGGSDPALLAEATAIAVAHGFDEINLNCGCPSDRVQAGRFGACLMREPALVAACVNAMQQAAGHVPVSVKCRLGVDDDNDYERFRGFVDTVADAGCRHFIIHARNAWLKGLSPKENRDIPPLRYEWAWRLKQDRPHLTLELNGGLVSLDVILAQQGRVDGVMIGRAAYHQPYWLHQLDCALRQQVPRSRLALLLAYRPYVERQLAQGVLFKHIARHMLGLFHGEPGGRAFRQLLSEGSHKAGHEVWLLDEAIALVCRYGHTA